MGLSTTPPIPEPAPGDAVGADWARTLVRALRSMRLSGGPGVRVSTTPEGTTVSAAPGAAASGRAEILLVSIPRVSGRAVRGTGRPLSGKGAARAVECWAADLADEEGPAGPFTVVGFPAARMVAEAAAPGGEEG